MINKYSDLGINIDVSGHEKLFLVSLTGNEDLTENVKKEFIDFIETKITSNTKIQPITKPKTTKPPKI